MVDAADDVHAKHREMAEGGCVPGPVNSFDAMGSTWTAFYCPVGDGIDIEVKARVATSASSG